MSANAVSRIFSNITIPAGSSPDREDGTEQRPQSPVAAYKSPPPRRRGRRSPRQVDADLIVILRRQRVSVHHDQLSVEAEPLTLVIRGGECVTPARLDVRRLACLFHRGAVQTGEGPGVLRAAFERGVERVDDDRPVHGVRVEPHPGAWSGPSMTAMVHARSVAGERRMVGPDVRGTPRRSWRWGRTSTRNH